MFLKSHLPQLAPQCVLTGMDAAFIWKVRNVGPQIAGLVTADMLCRRISVVREAEMTPRLMHAEHGSQSLAKGLTGELLTVQAMCPFSDTSEEILLTAADACSASVRVQVAADGIAVYNRNSHRLAQDAFELWPQSS